MTARALLVLLASILGSGCADPPSAAESFDVKAGRSASAYRYGGVLYRGPAAFCTGSLIAPRVVMTAAHCLDDDPPEDMWVELPWLDAQPVVGATTRYRDPSGRVHTGETPGGSMDFDQHDIALAILVQPVDMDRFPRRATSGSAARTVVFGIGRRQGTSAAPLLRSPDEDLEHDGPLNYRVRRGWAGDYLEPGDSGGPWVRAADGVIIGVHRGGEAADNIYPLHASACWIAHVVAAYGGEGPQGASGAVPDLEDFCGR